MVSLAFRLALANFSFTAAILPSLSSKYLFMSSKLAACANALFMKDSGDKELARQVILAALLT
jgi:hypothetical protein